MSLLESYTGEATAYKSSLFNNDIVEFIIREVTFPNSYLEEIQKKNDKIGKQNDKMGTNKPYIKPNHKEGGMALNVTILNRTNEDGEIQEFDDELATEKALHQSIVMLTPQQFYDRGYDFKHERRGGKTILGQANKYIGMFNKDTAEPYIYDLYPSVQEYAVWDNGQKIKVASEITDDDLNDLENGKEYQRILENENARIAQWEKILEHWKTIDEDDAKNFLLLALSSRLLLHETEPKKGTIYLFPEEGMRFQMKVKKKGKYTNFISFEWDKHANNGKGGYIHYSNGTSLPNEKDKELAKTVDAQQIMCYA